MRTFFRAAALAAALAFSALAVPYSFKPSVSVSVGTSATALAVNTRHTFVRICNTDTAKTVFWSFDSSVTTSTGSPLYAMDCLNFDSLSQGQLLYAVTTSTTADVRVTEGFTQ